MSSDTASRAKALAAAVLWGVSFVATKAALREVHPVTLIVLRFGIGIVVLALIVWRRHIVQTIGRRDLVILAVLGIIGVTVHQGLQSTGLEYTSASSMAWLVALNPVFTALLALVFLAEPFGGIKIIGLGIAFVGAILVVTNGALSTETLHLPSTIGDGLALASALNWAIFSVASKPVLKRVSPTVMMFLVMSIGWLIILPFAALGKSWNEIGNLSGAGWLAIGFLGIFCSGLAYIFWYDALSNIQASQVAAFIYLEPLVTVAVASVILSEPFTLITVLGGLTILVGVYLVNRPEARPAAGEVPVVAD